MDGLRKWQIHTCFFLTYPPVNRSIISRARTNIYRNRINETGNGVDSQHNSPPSRVKGRSSSPGLPLFRSYKPKGVDIEGLIQSRNFTLKVIGLRRGPRLSCTLDLRLKADATSAEIMVAIKDAGVSLMILPMLSPRLRWVL